MKHGKSCNKAPHGTETLDHQAGYDAPFISPKTGVFHCGRCHAAIMDHDELELAEQSDPIRSLRDELAMAALAGLLLNDKITCESEGQFASWAYRFADAMMLSRRKQTEKT